MVIDEQSSLITKKTLLASNWVWFNKDGDNKVLDLDKYSILRRLGIHARDLRILDPLLSYPSTILGRERAIIVNLEVLLRDPSDEYVIPMVKELERRFASPGAFLEAQGEDDEQSADFPFEFRALEVMLEAICSHLDARTTELETAAYPALDELTSKVREELEQLLDDDEDMEDLYLSRKLSRHSSPASFTYAPCWYLSSPALRSKASKTSRASGVSVHEEHDVEELEMLLEAYFMQIDSTMNKLTTVSGHTRGISKRNNLLNDNDLCSSQRSCRYLIDEKGTQGNAERNLRRLMRMHIDEEI
ncbi:hypothetical protein KSS87_017489 [Heliosperma pusillum]|nr:hypothetical protein KSS87_017489 [Heliosperma pusillum]